MEKNECNTVVENATKNRRGIAYSVYILFLLTFIHGMCGCERTDEVNNTYSMTLKNTETQNECEIRFQKDSVSGVITDSNTGNQWLVGPDGDVTFWTASDWVDNLGGNWRLPIRSELRELRDAGINSNNWGVFRNSGTRVWSAEVQGRLEGESAFYIRFYTNDHSSTTLKSRYLEFRVFAIRSSGPDRFAMDSEGIITDNVTALEWLVGPDEDTNWYQAQDWIESLGSGWRIPSRTELQALYDAGIIRTNMGFFDISNDIVWTSDLYEEPGTLGNRTKVIVFLFYGGSGMRVSRDYDCRAFAVRSVY